MDNREFEGIEEDIKCHNAKCDCDKRDGWQAIRFIIVVASLIAMILIKGL